MKDMELRNDSNVVAFDLDDGADPTLVSASLDKFVLLRVPDLDELRALLVSFREKYIGGLREIFRTVNDEDYRTSLPMVFALGGAEMRGNKSRIDGERKKAWRTSRFSGGAVKEGIEALGFDKKHPIGDDELTSARIPRLSIEDQARLADWLTADPLEEWANRIHPNFGECRLWIDPGIENDLEQTNDPLQFLDEISGACNDLFIRGTCRSRLKNRPIARYWFAKHLHHAGVWLFPLDVWGLLLLQGTPGALKPLARTCLLHEGTLDFWDGWIPWVKSNSTSKNLEDYDPYIRAVRWIDHTSTFFPNMPICSDVFEYYNEHFRRLTSKQHGLIGSRFLFRYLHEYHGVSLADDHATLKLAGKTKLSSREAWAWVDDPKVNLREGHYEKIVGRPEPDVQPAPIVAWARQMRDLLPLFGVKSVQGKINSLTNWLLYLRKLYDLGLPLPTDLSAIDRLQHINAAGTGHYTFMEFMKERDIALDRKNQAISDLRQMWIHDATQRNLSPAGCPILQRTDRIKGKRSSTRHWRTVREAMEPEIWQIIVEENRKNDFEFSKERTTITGKLTDWCGIRDPETGQHRREWFPGLAVIVDLLLNIPFRKAHARYLDSGEGDEMVLDIDILEYGKNVLPTAIKGRKQGFFMRSKLGIGRHQVGLGMFINTNKTGPEFEVPWIDKEVAKNVHRVIEWQKKYNPIDGPVKATRVTQAQERYGDLDLFDDTFPIFRDPIDPLHKPLSDGRIASYYYDLLEHCEPILSAKLGFEVSLFDDEGEMDDIDQDEGEEDDIQQEVIEDVDADDQKPRRRGRPIFDLHSLRVTGVTSLLAHGVPIEIVQRLVGHASEEMTWYYNAVSNARTRDELQRAMEARKITAEDLRKMTQEDLRRLKANVFNTRSEDDFAAFSMFERQILSRTSQWELLPHGICSGGRCSEGGAKTKTGYLSLHRERACSLCRFRITGPMFLAGLVLHQNTLLWEIKQSLRNKATLAEKMNCAEDGGRDPGPLRSGMRREAEHCEKLFEEWFAEAVYVREAEGRLSKWISTGSFAGKGGNLPALFGQGETPNVSVGFCESHELQLLRNLCKDAEIVGGAQLPRGIEEDRNALLLQIARANNLEEFFYRLDPGKARVALGLFADAILDSFESGPAGMDDIESLVTGETSIRHLPALEERIAEVLQKIGPDRLRVTSRGQAGPAGVEMEVR